MQFYAILLPSGSNIASLYQIIINTFFLCVRVFVKDFFVNRNDILATFDFEPALQNIIKLLSLDPAYLYKMSLQYSDTHDTEL